jgi:hypothetical protein
LRFRPWLLTSTPAEMKVESRHAQQRTSTLERGTGACQVEQRGQFSVAFQARRRAAQCAAWIPAGQRSALRPARGGRVSARTAATVLASSIDQAVLWVMARNFHPRPGLLLLKAQIWEERSMRAIVAAGALVALVSPALAAETFYVEQDTATKRCRVVSELPSAIVPANIQVVGPQDAAYNEPRRR